MSYRIWESAERESKAQERHFQIRLSVLQLSGYGLEQVLSTEEVFCKVLFSSVEWKSLVKDIGGGKFLSDTCKRKAYSIRRIPLPFPLSMHSTHDPDDFNVPPKSVCIFGQSHWIFQRECGQFIAHNDLYHISGTPC